MSAPEKHLILTDDLGRTVRLAGLPRRIVCLCPSLTETLFELGAGTRVVGRTRYCVLPAGTVDAVMTVGGTKDIDEARVAALKPDLIIAEKEENPREAIERLAEHWPVYVFDVTDFEGGLDAVARLGTLIGADACAAECVRKIRAAFDALCPLPPTRAAYLIWRNPYMAAGRGTFINALLERCGFVNACAAEEERYPRVDLETLRARRPDYVLLSSEPFPFDESHRRELEAQLPGMRVILVDGRVFGWYGAHMATAGRYLASLSNELRKSDA